MYIDLGVLFVCQLVGRIKTKHKNTTKDNLNIKVTKPLICLNINRKLLLKR